MLNIKLKSTKNLLRVLSTAENILRANKGENDLRYVKFEKVGDNLCLTAMNSFMRLYYYSDEVESIEGDCALYENKVLMSLFTVLDGAVEISDGVIRGKKCEYSIPNIAIENYPTTVFPDITERIELDSECFKNAIEGVIAATDKFEGILSGVYIDNDKLVTCDQKRIFISALGKNINNIVLPKDLVSEVGRLPFKDKIYLSTFGNSVIIEDGSIFLSCNTLSGKYPKYEAILPKEVRDEFVVDKEVFENALNLVAPIINEDTWECNLEVNNNNMLVYTKDGKRKAETSIGVDMLNSSGEAIKVKFNIQMLMDMLKANSGKINVKTYSDNIGLMFSSGSAKQYIMPLID